MNINKTLHGLMGIFLGCFFTFLLSTRFQLSPILSSSTIGLIFTFAPIHSQNKEHFQSSAYIGTFLGMSSTYVIGDFIEMFSLILFATFLSFILQRKFNGLGGKLGTIAFLGVGILMLQKGKI